MTTFRAPLIAAAVLAGWPALAFAQTTGGQVVATAPPAQTPAPAQPTAQVSTVPDAPVQPDTEAPPRDRRIHGEVSVGVGTGGYREGEVSAEGPIGDTGYGSIDIGAGQTSWGRR